MKKEFGKWLLDVAKYVATAFLISSFLGDIERRWIMYLTGSVTVIITLSIGLWLVHAKNKKEREN
ncbi:hypothetical protein EZS27_001068 [termite gut metagenome]|uniref:Uncharacterized protein n=1 Tax=termite gut metagenome TaxID=433724 RepID=A0A5J4T278_9ZZZZ